MVTSSSHEGETSIDLDRQHQARRYARVRLLWRIATIAVSLVSLALLGPVGGAVALRDAVEGATNVWPLQVALFFSVLGAMSALIQAPLTYYSDLLLTHRYGLSTQSFRDWLLDMLKGAALAALLGGVAVECLYAFLRIAPGTWWLWSGLAYTCLMVVLTVLIPILILPLFFKIRPLSDPFLERQVQALVGRAHSGIAAVGEIDLSSKTTAANAAVIGLGRTRRIVLGDTLLSNFPPEEVDVVVAHELGHHVHRDVIKGLVLSTLLSLTGFAVAGLCIHIGVSRFHFRGEWDLAAFPVLAASLGIWNSLTHVAELAYSRYLESRADTFSLALTNDPRAFISSEVRLTNQNLAWFDPPIWVEILFHSHPAPWRRVAMGEQYAVKSTLV